jgi:hypothetical protein
VEERSLGEPGYVRGPDVSRSNGAGDRLSEGIGTQGQLHSIRWRRVQPAPVSEWDRCQLWGERWEQIGPAGGQANGS